MKKQRADNQKVDAFSAPLDLLRAAQLEAKRRRMTKSGFYRYCLAKELGLMEDEALRVAEHAGVGNFSVVQSGSNNTQTVFSDASDAPAPKPLKYPKAGKPRKKKG